MENIIIERDVPIQVDDRLVLRADIFRPKNGKPAPGIMSLGPYGKGVPAKEAYSLQYNVFFKINPNALSESTKSLITRETPDPEIWVSWGYVCIRVYSRGTGRSLGRLEIISPREIKDFYDAIEGAGIQPWCNGKIGLLGISYYAITQWLVAALQPLHLTAMIPWEGAADFYRDMARHSGIFSNGFVETWYPRQVLTVQHGNPRVITDPWLRASASGGDLNPLDDEQLRNN